MEGFAGSTGLRLRRARARLVIGGRLCERRKVLGADLLDDGAQFLHPFAEPSEVIGLDPVVLGLCRAAHYAEWERERPAFQQLCADRLGIVFIIRSESIDTDRPQ